MAETSVPVTSGGATPVAAFIDPSSNYRQVMVLGDSVAANVATVDASGRLLVSEANAALTTVTNTITTSTGTVTADSTSDIARAGSATVYLFGATHAGFNVTFEISPDGTNWFPIQAQRTDTAAMTTAGATGVLTTNSLTAWDVSPLLGVQQLRVRASARTSGTLSVSISPAIRAVEVSPTIVPSGTQTVDTELPAAAALADAVSGTPTTATVGVIPLLYNGGTMDRQRGNVNFNTGDTGAKTATGNGASQTNMNATGVSLLFNIGTVSGTTPTCVFKVQASNDNGTTWYDLPGAATTSITATGAYVLMIYPGPTAVANSVVSLPLPRTWRVVWTIGGTTPSFTITNVQAGYIL